MAKKTTKKAAVAKLKNSLVKDLVAATPPSPRDMLSSSVTTLNLACSDSIHGAFAKGHFYHLVGDSGAGKTWIVHALFAEAQLNRRFDEYRFIYDAPEKGAIMDKVRYFGRKTAERIETPAGGDSYYVEDFYRTIRKLLDAGDPFVYVLDSESSLTSKAEEKKAAEADGAIEKDEDAKGSYGDGKAKIHSANLRSVTSRLHETGSMLFISSQTRDNIGFGAKFNPKVYAGGKALKFYATLQIWFAIKEKLKKKFRGKDRQPGIVAGAHVVKNRNTGKDRWVEFPIYHSVGIDDVGGCVDYLLEENYWKKSKEGVIEATDLELSATRDKLIAEIEERGLERALRYAVAEVWQSIEDAVRVERKSRYE